MIDSPAIATKLSDELEASMSCRPTRSQCHAQKFDPCSYLIVAAPLLGNSSTTTFGTEESKEAKPQTIQARRASESVH